MGSGSGLKPSYKVFTRFYTGFVWSGFWDFGERDLGFWVGLGVLPFREFRRFGGRDKELRIKFGLGRTFASALSSTMLQVARLGRLGVGVGPN